MFNSKALDVMEFINNEHSGPNDEDKANAKPIRNDKMFDYDVRNLFMPMLLWNGFSCIEFQTDSRAVIANLDTIKEMKRDCKYPF